MNQVNNSQLLPVAFLRRHFGTSRKALWVYAILRQNGIGNAGYTRDHISFLQSYGIAKSTAYRVVASLRRKGWLVDSKSGIRITSVHTISETKNKYCIPTPSSMLDSYKIFSNFIFTSLLLSKVQADFKRQNRSSNIVLEKVNDEDYRSYDKWAACTTEEVASKYIGISQPTFNRLKKSSAKSGMLTSRYALDLKKSFGSKEEALNVLGWGSNSFRIQKIQNKYVYVIGSILNINSFLKVYKYS